MLKLIIIGFLASFLAPTIYKRSKEYFGWIAASFPLYMFFSFIMEYPRISSGENLRESTPWLSSLGINLSFYLDGLSLTFALIITLIGTAVFLYAGSYMKSYSQAGRFYLYIGVFMTSMLGLVLSDNMITLFVFWELTSISSYLLIGFNHTKETSRKNALQALLITGAGGLALLAGLVLLSQISNSFEISSLYDLNSLIIGDSNYTAIVLLILLGAFTKSAQFPFHFWLPNAMEAPTPVSAYLHSATMVKAGIYLIARMNHVLGGTVLWQDTILIIGTITMLIGALLSFKQTDLKRLLAYSTLSVLGTLTLLLGIGSNLAIKAFFIFLVAHSLYKGTLFLVAGSIDHETGTRDINHLGGLKNYMPYTMMAAVLASFSMMGIIPLIGFISKETVYSSILEVENFGVTLLLLAFISNALIVMVTILVGVKPFLGKIQPTPNLPHEPPIKMILGPIVLASLGLLIGIFPNTFVQKLLDQSTLSILSIQSGFIIKIWHGFNFVLLLSFLTLIAGIFLFFFRQKALVVLSSMKLIKYIKPSYWYDTIIDFVLLFGKHQTLLLQNGYLRYYIIFIVLTTLGLAGYSMFKVNIFEYISFSDDFTIYELVIALIIVASTFLVITSDSRLKAIVAIGAVGFCMGIIFILYSAPDLALTTIAIETLTVILFVLVLYRLPKYLKFSRVTSKTRDLIIASGVGIFMGLTVLIVTAGNMQSELKKYFAEASLPGGKGRNIVNVILVDFRAIDTLGEITVLAVAAIGVYALIKLRLKEDDE